MASSDAPHPALAVALPWLWGARVQRIDSPADGLFVFTLYDKGNKQSLLLSVHPQRLGAGITDQRPVGLPASPFVRRLRVAADNATVLEAHWLGGAQPQLAGALTLKLARKDTCTTLVADFHGQQPNLFLLDELGNIAGAMDERARRQRFPERRTSYTAPVYGKAIKPETPEQALQSGARLLADRQQHTGDARRDQARSQAKTTLKRLDRKVAAIESDLARAQTAPVLRREGNLLLCHLAAVPRGASQVQLLDEVVDPPELIEITLDPALPAQQNAERRFSRARRLERGLTIAKARLDEARAEADKFRAFLTALDAETSEPLEDAATQLGIRLNEPTSPARARQRGAPSHVAYRVFEGAGGHRILVGKGAVDNDTLTLTVARPQDLWLHARSVHGAHVIIPRDRNAQLPSELLIDAAHLAAHFSDVRGEATAEIQHTEKRYLRKPKGSAPGAVRVDRERVLLLRVDAERLRRLLAAERPP